MRGHTKMGIKCHSFSCSTTYQKLFKHVSGPLRQIREIQRRYKLGQRFLHKGRFLITAVEFVTIVLLLAVSLDHKNEIISCYLALHSRYLYDVKVECGLSCRSASVSIGCLIRFLYNMLEGDN